MTLRSFSFESFPQIFSLAKQTLETNLESLLALKSLIEIYSILQEYLLIESEEPSYLPLITSHAVTWWAILNSENLEDQDEESSLIMEMKQ